MGSRQPKQLLLAFFGEHVVDGATGPIRASVLINVLEGADVAAPATRATLDRLVHSGILARSRSGRETLFSLTDHGVAVLREAKYRVRGPRPFDPQGSGWTLVTFSIPEGQRMLRHRLRSTLTWEGFAPIRDGLWLAPGEVDLAGSLAPLRQDLAPNTVVAFHARELAGFPIAERTRGVGHRGDPTRAPRLHRRVGRPVGGDDGAECPHRTDDARGGLARAAARRPEAAGRVHGRGVARHEIGGDLPSDAREAGRGVRGGVRRTRRRPARR